LKYNTDSKRAAQGAWQNNLSGFTPLPTTRIRVGNPPIKCKDCGDVGAIMADGTRVHAARLLCLSCGGFLSWIPYVARDFILSEAAKAEPGTIIEYPRFDKSLDGSFITNRAKPCKCGSVLSSLKHERGVNGENCGAYAGAISESSLKFLKRAVELFGPLTNSRGMPAIEVHHPISALAPRMTARADQSCRPLN
jgi:hypothetical protein